MRKLFLVPLLACLTVAAQAQTPLMGRVVAVADGDTITVLDASKTQHRIRLNGIDAPESGQPFGTVAKTHLSVLVFGQDVVVVGDKVDRYGRRVGTVTVGPTNANLEQLRAGLAWYYREYARDVPVELRPIYEAAETTARQAGLGLWRDPSPQAPWAFRNPPAPTVAALAVPAETGTIIGNKSSNIYHAPGCRDYDRVAPQNRVYFATETAAEQAGFRKARNC